MALVVPCIRGRMGSTPYYEAKVPARELAHMVRPAEELDAWSSWGVEERLQRDLDRKRIQSQIVPYLTRSADRFFGSFIVLVYQPDRFEFEPIEKLAGSLPAAYAELGEDMGCLTISGGDLIMLDGQHRLVALRTIVDGDAHGEHARKVPNDELCVIYVRHESNEKTRRIFNKVNRYAKQTSRGDNIITSEDDGYAILTRRLLADGEPLGLWYETNTGERELIVNWRSNTIPARSRLLTTVSAVYETVEDILAHDFRKGFNEEGTVNRPSDEDLESAYQTVRLWWERVLDGVMPFQQALADTESIPSYRKPNEPYSLLFKPVGQVVLFKGLIRAVGRGVNLALAIERARHIDWKINSDIWRGTIVQSSGRINAGKAAKNLAAELLAYLLAPEGINQTAKARLKKDYNKARGYDYEDPTPGERPQALPDPVTKMKGVV